jgi:hypothetical protein
MDDDEVGDDDDTDRPYFTIHLSIYPIHPSLHPSTHSSIHPVSLSVTIHSSINPFNPSNHPFIHPSSPSI